MVLGVGLFNLVGNNEMVPSVCVSWDDVRLGIWIVSGTVYSCGVI